jgi:hypothetical protein
MDFGIITRTAYPATINSSAISSKSGTENQNIDNLISFPAQKPVIDDKAMMDLEDVQKFLYMLIGSHIKVEAENNMRGTTFNSVA